MTKLIHHSPLGKLWIPDIGEVDAETPFDAPADIAAGLLIQTGLYDLAGEGETA